MSPSPPGCAPTARAMPARTCSRRVAVSSGNERDPIKSVMQQFGDSQCQAGLADPPRSGKRHQPHLGPTQQPGDLVDGMLTPHKRGSANRQSA